MKEKDASPSRKNLDYQNDELFDFAEKKDKQRYSKLQKIGAVVTLLATLVTPNLAGCSDKDTNNNNSNNNNETEMTQEQIIDSLEIPAGLSDKELAETVLDRMDAWGMGGFNTPESEYDLVNNRLYKMDINHSDWSAEKVTNTVSAEVATEQAEIFKEAIIVDNYEDYPQLKEVIEKLEKLNSINIKNFLISNNYVTTTELDEGTPIKASEQSGERVLTLYVTEYIKSYNAETGKKIDTSGNLTITVKVIEKNGNAYLTYIDIKDR